MIIKGTNDNKKVYLSIINEETVNITSAENFGEKVLSVKNNNGELEVIEPLLEEKSNNYSTSKKILEKCDKLIEYFKIIYNFMEATPMSQDKKTWLSFRIGDNHDYNSISLTEDKGLDIIFCGVNIEFEKRFSLLHEYIINQLLDVLLKRYYKDEDERKELKNTHHGYFSTGTRVILDFYHANHYNKLLIQNAVNCYEKFDTLEVICQKIRNDIIHLYVQNIGQNALMFIDQIINKIEMQWVEVFKNHQAKQKVHKT